MRQRFGYRDMHPERHFTWRRLLVLAAVRETTKPKEGMVTRQITTEQVCRIAERSRRRTNQTLLMAERLAYVERKRAAHGKSYWWITKEGQTFLYKETSKRSRLTENEGDKIMINPVPIVRRAMRAKRLLLGIGWTERQARWVMRFRTVGKIERVIRKARKVATFPGAYAMTCLRPASYIDVPELRRRRAK